MVTGNPEDAEDAVQTVFVRLAENGIPANISDNPAGYFYRAAINESRHIIRTRVRHRLDENEGSAPEPSTDTSPLVEDARERLLDAFSQLSRKDRKLLQLYFQDGFTDAEIATRWNSTRSVIAVSLHRAKTRLKKLLMSSCPAARFSFS